MTRRLLIHQPIVSQLQQLVAPLIEGVSTDVQPNSIKGVNLGDITWDIENGGKAYWISNAVVHCP